VHCACSVCPAGSLHVGTSRGQCRLTPELSRRSVRWGCGAPPVRRDSCPARIVTKRAVGFNDLLDSSWYKPKRSALCRRCPAVFCGSVARRKPPRHCGSISPAAVTRAWCRCAHDTREARRLPRVGGMTGVAGSRAGSWCDALIGRAAVTWAWGRCAHGIREAEKRVGRAGWMAWPALLAHGPAAWRDALIVPAAVPRAWWTCARGA
jgi:hypothetical protein